MTSLLAVVAAPAAGAAATALVRGRGQRGLGLAAGVATAVAAVMLAWRVGAAGEPLTVRGTTPLGTDLVATADGLAVAMVLAASAVGLVGALFAALESEDRPGASPAYWPLWLLLWTALHALFLAGDLFGLYLMLELLSITGAALVSLKGEPRALVASARYYYAELVASLTFLLGLALVWGQAGTLVLDALPAELGDSGAGRLALGVLTAGLLLKVPLVPLHFWLPPAHWLAPSAVSPILSAVVVKSAFTVLLRLWFVALPAAPTAQAALLLGVLGAAAVVWGSLNALRAPHLKLLIAHSTVAQLGLLFLLPPLVLAGAGQGWTGGVLQAVGHALPKAALLLAAVALTAGRGSDDLAATAGAAARRPVAVFAFGLAAVSLVGLPPTVGFVAKWYLLLASLETGQWWWVPLIVVGSLLTAAYLMRVLSRALGPGDPAQPRTVGPVDLLALVLALGALALGLWPGPLLELLEVGAPLPGPGGG